MVPALHRKLPQIEHFWKTNRPFASGLGLIWCGIAIWALWDRPSPGISIGLLAAGAGLMSLRPPDMHFIERITWIAILIALVTAEILSIGKSDKDNLQARKDLNESFKSIREQQQSEFDATAAGLKEAINENELAMQTSQSGFEETMNKSSEIMKGVEANLAAQTGEDSFPIFSVLFMSPSLYSGSASGISPLVLLIVGNYPMKISGIQIQKADSPPQSLVNCQPCMDEYLRVRAQSTHGIPISEGLGIPGPHFLSERVDPGKYQIDVFSLGHFYMEMLDFAITKDGTPTQSHKLYRDGVLMDEKKEMARVTPKQR
jgi:hypothetical protein